MGASGWKKILSDGPKINKWIESNVGQIIWNNFLGDIVQLKHRHKEQLPNAQDVYGAALGIVRLWCTYRIDLKALVKNGKIIARLGDRKNVESEKSVMKLNGEYILLVHLFIFVWNEIDFIT